MPRACATRCSLCWKTSARRRAGRHSACRRRRASLGRSVHTRRCRCIEKRSALRDPGPYVRPLRRRQLRRPGTLCVRAGARPRRGGGLYQHRRAPRRSTRSADRGGDRPCASVGASWRHADLPHHAMACAEPASRAPLRPRPPPIPGRSDGPSRDLAHATLGTADHQLASPGVKLLLGGQGPLTPELERSGGDAGVGDRVVFLGRIAEAELPAYYHACDVFCLPSVEPAEGFGIVQIEAMACGKPVVCCELHNGVTWVNRDGVTGLVVPPADSKALAAALARLGGDAALRARLGEQGRARALAEFTTEAMCRGTLRVYQQVLGSRR